MRASKTYSYDPAKAGSTNINFSPWGGSGGNPELEPWRANAFDVSYEKYFGRQAYVSLAGFYKDLKTYVYDQNLVFDFTGFPVTSGPEPALRKGVVSTPQNGKGGLDQGRRVHALDAGRSADPGPGWLRCGLLGLAHRQQDPAEPERSVDPRSRGCRRTSPT